MASAIEMVPTDNDEPRLTAAEAGRLIGLKPWSIYEKAKRGMLRSYVITGSRTLRFRRSDVLALLQPRSTESNP